MKRDFENATPDRYGLLKVFAREHRNNPTEAESLLWNYIKANQLGVKFKRQLVIYDYIADFACLEKKLIVELDGEYHFTEAQQIKDMYRTDKLETMGFKVLRFTNKELFSNIDNVINRIKTEILNG